MIGDVCAKCGNVSRHFFYNRVGARDVHRCDRCATCRRAESLDDLCDGCRERSCRA